MTSQAGNHRLKELILYISKRSEGDESFGAVKLNKLLFYSDFIAYKTIGASITGQEYHRLPHGPAPRGVLPAVEELKDQDAAVVAERAYHAYTQKRIIPLREAELAVFDGREIAIVEAVIREHWGMSASQISEKSHEFAGWALAEDKGTIPDYVALVEWPEPGEEQRQRGRALAGLADAWLSQQGEAAARC